MNPTEQFREEVRSAVTPPTPKDWDKWSLERQLGYDLCWRDIKAEALASIQAATVELLEGLKKGEHPSGYQDDKLDKFVSFTAIDQLIKDLSNE